MAKFLCAFAIFALMAVTANALKCYECPTGCKGDDKTQWPTQDCGITPAGSTKVCQKQVQEIKGSPNRIIRKCNLVPEGQKLKCSEIPTETTLSCESCTTDLCNSASSITFNTLAIASIVLPFLATRLY